MALSSGEILQIKNETQLLEPKVQSMTNIQGVDVLLKEMVEIEKRLNQYMKESEQKIENAKKMQSDAESYKAKTIKIGSAEKKAKMLAKAQLAMVEAMSSMQQGQATMFKFQNILAHFVQKSMYMCMNNDRNLNDLANIIWKYKKNAEIPEQIKSTVEKIYDDIAKLKYEQEEARKVLEKNKAKEQNELISSNSDIAVSQDNSKLYLSCAVIIGIAIIISSIIK